MQSPGSTLFSKTFGEISKTLAIGTWQTLFPEVLLVRFINEW
jgi:hypothetical protein